MKNIEISPKMQRALDFRRGQRDRNSKLPCQEANGSYLDGWYSPEKTVPPSITEDELPLIERLEAAL